MSKESNRTLIAFGMTCIITCLSNLVFSDPSTEIDAQIDKTGPTVTHNRKEEFSIVDVNSEPELLFKAFYSDTSGIDTSKIRIIVNGEDVTPKARINQTNLTYKLSSGSPTGLYHAKVMIVDTHGNTTTLEWDIMYQPC